MNSNEEVAKENYDLIVVENLELLPFALRTESIVKVLFDAREFFTKEFEKSIRFKIFDSFQQQTSKIFRRLNVFQKILDVYLKKKIV